jgi:DNA-binding response OmpR family regulator
MLTAKTDVPDRVAGINAGADDYLGKPFAFEELVARLRALGRRSGAEPDVLRSGAVVMNLTRHEVRYEGRYVDLTLREYELLECFLRRPGHALTRSQLLDHVWDLNFETDTTVVDTYVHYLRRKLAAAGCPNPIATIRGVGYAWRG